MRWHRLFLAFVASAAAACGPAPDIIFELAIDAQTTKVPASVKQGEALTINITAIGSSGCVGFEGIEAERTSEHLTLRVLGRRPAGNAVCPALAPIFAQQYTDAGLSARVNPFEVVINGTRYLVTVEP